MKRNIFIILLCAAVLVLCFSACGSGDLNAVPEGAKTFTLMAIYDDNILVAGEEEFDLYFIGTKNLNIRKDGKEFPLEDLSVGMTVAVKYDSTDDSYPGGISADTVYVTGYSGTTATLIYDVFCDLMDDDTALNADIKYIGFDLSKASGMTAGEKGALKYILSGKYGYDLTYLEGTFDELCEQGYIDKENLFWEDGILLTFEVESPEGSTISFSADKWRSGLGAIFYGDCTGKLKDGKWTYEIGSYAIS